MSRALATYLFIYLFIINFSQKDRSHIKGEHVLAFCDLIQQ